MAKNINFDHARKGTNFILLWQKKKNLTQAFVMQTNSIDDDDAVYYR